MKHLHPRDAREEASVHKQENLKFRPPLSLPQNCEFKPPISFLPPHMDVNPELRQINNLFIQPQPIPEAFHRPFTPPIPSASLVGANCKGPENKQSEVNVLETLKLKVQNLFVPLGFQTEEFLPLEEL